MQYIFCFCHIVICSRESEWESKQPKEWQCGMNTGVWECQNKREEKKKQINVTSHFSLVYECTLYGVTMWYVFGYAKYAIASASIVSNCTNTCITKCFNAKVAANRLFQLGNLGVKKKYDILSLTHWLYVFIDNKFAQLTIFAFG